MAHEYEPSCVVSGSFTKFKPQIDEAIGIFASRGVKVLSPRPGGLYLPTQNTLWRPGSYPLQSELYISEKQAKRNHLTAIEKADFLYVVNPGQYTGRSVLAEFRCAYILQKPVYALEPFDPALDDYEPLWLNIIQYIEAMPPREVANLYQDYQPRPPFTVVRSQNTVAQEKTAAGFIDYRRRWEDVVYHGGPRPETVPHDTPPGYIFDETTGKWTVQNSNL